MVVRKKSPQGTCITDMEKTPEIQKQTTLERPANIRLYDLEQEPSP